ncbi:hypothetical protein EW145_g7005 [Phellinidium pouzarii]|uniref:Hydrophobin n=1 Tax=Phellinidium pouzarii TaxID=167371 RepID=A0A4S4KQQ6_9AGAM|nr:hypothetical protein EW145_g7005 [Phellinidium pouzarii]
MKFTYLATALALPLLAVATPTTPLRRGGTTTVTVTATPTATTISQCNTGPAQCCQSTSSSEDPVTQLLLGLLGVVLEGITADIGITCSPILGNTCDQAPVCCENNNFNGLIAIGCSPITL